MCARRPFVRDTSVFHSRKSRLSCEINNVDTVSEFAGWIRAELCASATGRDPTTHPVRYLGHTWILNRVTIAVTLDWSFPCWIALAQTLTKYAPDSKCHSVCHRSQICRELWISERNKHVNASTSRNSLCTIFYRKKKEKGKTHHSCFSKNSEPSENQ